jgi:hypothetical protein
MKLKFVFIVMDVLTLLAYPIVYVDGKLRQFSKFKRRYSRSEIFIYKFSYAGQMTD